MNKALHSVIASSIVVPMLPSELANLKWWLDANDFGSNGPISEWVDKSSQGINATQATEANQPTVVLNTLNGKPVVRFSTNDYMIANNLASTYTGEDKPFTFFFVLNRSSLTGTLQCLWHFSSSSSANPFHNGFIDNTGRIDLRFRDNGAAQKNAVSTLTMDLYNYYIISVLSTGTNVTAWVNGIKWINSVDINIGSMTINRFSLAAFNRTSPALLANFFNGDIAEVIMTNVAESDVTRKKIETHLRSKWGI
jgi:hypothetical protein